ncbi:farnesyltranstransferase [Coprinellus micaceus]|uniref:(2E,6E)-farnesyl diphosphate synthase n=1 Tax=Coprinellus micaceus TaxID=71717 RepID=A0A4Y7SG34_COPMI|nr:farnesyltranstransferase [Coprinellus micaceus]
MAIQVSSAAPVTLPAPTSSGSSSVSPPESMTLSKATPIDRPVSAYVGLPPWTEKNEKALLAPYTYIVSIPGKDLRTQLLRAFNSWYNLPDHTFNVISEVVGMLHNASLLFDDIEDYTELRRGQPVAHRVFGLPQTINTAAYAMFVAMSKLYTIPNLQPSTHQTLMDIFLEEIIELHRGQGLEIYWRETGTCPSEEEYFCMIKQKTGGLFRLGVRLMAACSPDVNVDSTSVVDLFSVFFQVRDDVMNLDSGDYAAAKGFAEDLTEGKFSFPVVHAISVSPAGDSYVLDTLQTHPTDLDVKIALVEHLRHKTKSLEYARALLRDLERKLAGEVGRLGGNKGLEGIMKKLGEY